MKHTTLLIILSSIFMSAAYSQDQPQESFDSNPALLLIIKSDRQVYAAGEKITIRCELKNSSDKPIKILDYYKPQAVRFDFKNEFGEHGQTVFRDLLRKILPAQLQTQGSVEIGQFTLNLPKEGENPQGSYKILGEHIISMSDGNFKSNTITVEVTDKLDVIDRLAERLSKDNVWENGVYQPIKLLSTAAVEKIIPEVFKVNGFDQGPNLPSGYVSNYKILQVKEVQILGSLPDQYIAALVQTNLGEKIVLLKYIRENLGWWNRVYDSKDF